MAAVAVAADEPTNLVVGHHTSMDYQYLRYVSHFNKEYRTLAEYQSRKELFQKTETILRALSHELETSTVGHNKFSDWTQDEIEHSMGLKGSASDIAHMRNRYAQFETDFLDDEVDWVQRGAVTDVRDQGHCGSSWAHATVASIEGAHFIGTDEKVTLSVQQLIDCDTANHGCEGGLADKAFEYVQEFALMSETEYPQVGQSDGVCHLIEGFGRVKVHGYINVVPNHPQQLKIAVSMAPVAALVAGSHPIFTFYRHGIITNEQCGHEVDTAVTIVGYGSSDGHDYWLIKNSWGTSWGEDGYGRIAVTDGAGVCGINSQPSIVFLE